MANEIKYVNQVFPENHPVAGERLSTNGYYTGEHKGTPTQDYLDEAGANADGHWVETATVRFGTMLQDATEGVIPSTGVGITQTLTACTSDTANGVVSNTENLEITYTADANKALPDSITVKIGGETATVSTDYTWTKATGKLAIAKAKITGDIEVTVTAS